MDELRTTEFNSLILATDAESALTILRKEAAWMECHVLGGIKLTVTHMDMEYMCKVTLFPFCSPIPTHSNGVLTKQHYETIGLLLYQRLDRTCK